MAFRRSPVRSRSGPPTFAHECRRRLPAIARSATAGQSSSNNELRLASHALSAKRDGGPVIVNQRATVGKPCPNAKRDGGSDAEAGLIVSAKELRLGKPWHCGLSELRS